MQTFASTQQVLITELYPAPSGSEPEWVELFNASSESAQLTGWWLTDEITTPTTIYQCTAQMAPLAPNEFRQVLLSGSKLNNSGDGVKLFNAQGELQSRLFYTESSTSLSQQRSSLTSEETLASTPTPNAGPIIAAASESTPKPTVAPTAEPSTSPEPHASNSPTPSPMVIDNQIPSDQVRITEISACVSDGQPEWIELFNSGVSLDVSSWRITDQSGNFRLLTGKLMGNDYTQFTWSGSLLNNSGDAFVISTATGQVLDSAEYTGCRAGKSLIKDSTGEWVDVAPSPGKSNPVTEKTQTASASSMAMPAFTTIQGEVAQNVTNSELTTQKTRPSTSDNPWIDPRIISLQPLVQQKQQSGSYETNTEPTILGTSIQRMPPDKPWGLGFVILSGLLLTLSGLVPPYAQNDKNTHQVDARLASATPLGRANLSI